MRISILPDIHLAPRQYGLKARRDDFFETFDTLIDEHVEGRDTDVIIFVGDFFDSRKVEALTFNRAFEILNLYKNNYNWVEGNHDRSVLRDDTTWILALNKSLKQSSQVFDIQGCKGKYIPLMNGSRTNVFMLDYMGIKTEEELEELVVRVTANFLSPLRRPRILIGHFGVSEFAGGSIAGTVSKDSTAFKKARACFDAIFLGHIHKFYKIDHEIEGKTVTSPSGDTSKDLCPVYGLGSMETLGFDELGDHAYSAIVDIDKSNDFKIEIVKTLRARKFTDLEIDCSGAKTPTEMVAIINSEIGISQTGGWDKLLDNTNHEGAVIRLTLVGEVPFDRLKVNVPKIREHVKERLRALHVILRNRLMKKGTELRIADAQTTRTGLEKETLLSIADDKYSVFGESLVELFQAVKDEVNQGTNEASLINLILDSRLMEDVDDNKES